MYLYKLNIKLMFKDKKILFTLSKKSGKLERLLRENAYPKSDNKNIQRTKSQSAQGYKQEYKKAVLKSHKK